MNKSILTVAVIGMLTLAGFGCTKTNVQQILAPITVKPTTEIKYFISPNGPDDKTKYCNGADMDSAGYKNVLTKEVTSTVAGELTRIDQIRTMLKMAAQDAGFSPNLADTANYVKVVSGTAYIAPTEGWAGVSIFMCNWQPFVEKNLEQFLEIKNVDWSISQEEFDKIK